MQDRTDISRDQQVPATESAGAGSTENVKERVDQAIEQFNQTVQQTREMAMQAGNEGREQAASGLEQASETVHSQVNKLTQTGERASVNLRQAADYIRNSSGESVRRDIMDWIRKNPSQALTIGLIAGFVIGRAIQAGSMRDTMSMPDSRRNQM